MADSNASQQFIVQGDPVQSGQLTEHLQREPGVKRVAQIAPDVVILSMTKTQADRLKSAFATLVVEPDSALKPFDAD